MPVVKLPDNLGVAIVRGTQSDADELKATLDARHAFVQKYCKEQGWTGELTFEQLMRIRQQDGWKNPVLGN